MAAEIPSETHKCEHIGEGTPLICKYYGEIRREKEGAESEQETVQITSQLCRECFTQMYEQMSKAHNWRSFDGQGIDLRNKALEIIEPGKASRMVTAVTKDPLTHMPLFVPLAKIFGEPAGEEGKDKEK